MNEQLISIIVPVYKSENYLIRCLESLIKQTYDKKEIILIYNPEANDNCPSICEKYSKEYKQVRLITQEDAGPSRARNEALKIARGDYISFVDSDDFVELDYFEQLIKGFKKYDDIGISMCQHTKYYHSDIKKGNKSRFENITKITNKDAFEMLLHNQELCAPWGKLYHSKLFKNNKFEITRNEDMFLMPKLFKDSGLIAFNDAKLYYYSQEGPSLVRSKYTEESIKTYYNANEFWVEFAKKNYPELVPMAFLLLNLNMIDLCQQMAFDKRPEIKSIYDKFRLQLLGNIDTLSSFKKLTWKDKIKFLLIKVRFTR
jgi:glycosyltransferase involved in cell wall biosynthesis